MNKAKFKKALREKTFCSIQHNGWTCGTCFYNISDTLEWGDWASLLLYRGDYKREDFDDDEEMKKKLPKDIMVSINKIWELIK